MKNLIAILFCVVSLSVNAQTPFTVTNSHEFVSPQDVTVAERSVSSLANPWIGASVVKNLRGDVGQPFLLEGRLVYQPIAGFPIVSNISFSNFDSIDLGNEVTLGVFPYTKFYDNGDLSLIAHGGFDYSFETGNAGDDELRFLIGVEAALYGENRSPITLSIAPELIINNGNSNWGLAVTGVIPIANGLGLLIQSDTPFNDNKSVVGIGFMVNGQLKK